MNTPLHAVGRPSDSRRLWSLWDVMINYQVVGLCNLLRNLREVEADFGGRTSAANLALQNRSLAAMPPTSFEVTDKDRKAIDGVLQDARQVAAQLELHAVLARVDLFERRLGEGVSIHDVYSDMRGLRETIEQGLNVKYFYIYPKEKAEALLQFDENWNLICDKFKSAAEDARAALDCWALGHNTASVFHLMRIAEYGLRALARERRVKLRRRQVLEWADWQTIIDEIRKTPDSLAKKSRGPARDAALEFYRGSLASFEGFKDAYRNKVMHVRKSYNEDEAVMLRNHVLAFMRRLAEKIDEHPKKQITWAARA